MVGISSELEEKIKEFQVVQNQLQMIAMQRQQSRLQIDDIKDALKQLDNATGKIYRFSGTLFLESSKDAAKKDLEEKVEIIAVRETAIARQEERIKKRAEELRAEIGKSPEMSAG
ncbi:MAG: prefoldin subunit beta [Candidatus Micrarchaeota archaeon]